MGMAGKKKLAVGLVVVAVLLGTGIHHREKLLNRMGIGPKSEPPTIFTELDSGPQIQPTFVGESTKLKRTVILPTLDTPMVAGKNNIWCSTFQLSWNEMKDTVIRAPIHVGGGAEELSRRLNDARQTKADLNEDSYYIAAGRVKEGIVEKIQTDMASRFPSVPKPTFDPDAALIAYSYLETRLRFKVPFLQHEQPLNFQDSTGNTSSVTSFGIRNGYIPAYKPIWEQIKILYCTHDPHHKVIEYALDLCKSSQPYQVVVAMVKPEETLEKTYQNLQELIGEVRDKGFGKNEDQWYQFDSVDDLAVPDMIWEITHHFTELEGKYVREVGGPVITAMQMIHFRMDRSGVVMKSEAKFAPKAISKDFILDKPFLLYLQKRDSEQPFFVMWVDNAELMRGF
jgi:hypothetical protein